MDSDAWPGVVRKTDLEIYRWLANVENYDHLAEVVRLLERASAAGCTFDGLLKTSSREQFASHTSELLVVEDLLDRGYQVATIARTGDRTPDLHVQGEGIAVAVEVYTPRELRAVDAFVSDVKDFLLNVDIAADYTARTGTDMEKRIPPEPQHLDPWAPDKFLEQTGEEVFAEISEDVHVALSELRPFEKVYRHGDTPLVTTVEIEDVRGSSSPKGPVRFGSLSYPGFSGYSPGGVFGRIVERA